MTSAHSPQTCMPLMARGAHVVAAQYCMVPARPPRNVLLVLMAPGALRVALLQNTSFYKDFYNFAQKHKFLQRI